MSKDTADTVLTNYQSVRIAILNCNKCTGRRTNDSTCTAEAFNITGEAASVNDNIICIFNDTYNAARVGVCTEETRCAGIFLDSDNCTVSKAIFDLGVLTHTTDDKTCLTESNHIGVCYLKVLNCCIIVFSTDKTKQSDVVAITVVCLGHIYTRYCVTLTVEYTAERSILCTDGLLPCVSGSNCFPSLCVTGIENDIRCEKKCLAVEIQSHLGKLCHTCELFSGRDLKCNLCRIVPGYIRCSVPCVVVTGLCRGTDHKHRSHHGDDHNN